MKSFLTVAVLSILFFSSCEKETKEYPNAIERTFPAGAFSTIKAGELFNIKIQQGETFSVKGKGRREDIEDLELIIDNGGFLEIRYDQVKSGRYHIDFIITMPMIGSVVLKESAKATLDGFAGQEIRIRSILSGSSECVINGSAEEMHVELDGASLLTLSGNTDMLFGNIKGQSRLNAYNMVSKIIEINTEGQSKTYVSPMVNFIVSANDQSEVYYKTEPVAKDIEINGQAKVVKQ